MKRISADLIHTNTGPPLENHCIVLNEKGTILEILPESEVEVDQHLPGTLIAGFVNAHCHLELSHMKGLIMPGNGLVEFALELFEKRKADPDVVQQAIHDADEFMYNNGIAAVGDISNGTTTINTKQNSRIHYHTFVEALGFREADADRAFDAAQHVLKAHQGVGLHASLAPHAPYSMSRNLLKRLADWYKKRDAVSTIHYFESIAEIEFCIYGTGEVNRILEYLNYPLHEITPYGEVGPSGALHFLNDVKQLLLVHNTYVNDTDLGIAHALFGEKLWLCACANANLYIENETPDFELWREHTDQICIGTDSLASNNALSVWNEMQTINKSQNVPFEALQRWATLNGANALNISDHFGSIDVGKTPGIIWLEHNGNESIWNATPKRIA